VITKVDMRWVKSELGTKALTERVAALRCGLDAALWEDEPASARCPSLVETAPERDAYGNVRYETLPFDTTRANALYEALFGPIADVIGDKHLLIVPSGALTQLPFQVLITNKPEAALSGREALRRAAWLARSHALTVLPSVSSLKALRQFAKESHADRTLIGFGNPLLNGTDARYAALAAVARSKTSCPELPKQRVAELTGKRRGVLPLTLRSGLADSGEIRSQLPLPETTDELCAVARGLRVSNKDIWLGNRATEAEIKRLSEAGELAKFRIVHFATHGALAGQLGANSEPGLILTPPNTATEGDDGYLSASEIATLKLDADWVILSACNTAAPHFGRHSWWWVRGQQRGKRKFRYRQAEAESSFACRFRPVWGHQQTKPEATIRWRPRSPLPSRPAVIGMFAVTVGHAKLVSERSCAKLELKNLQRDLLHQGRPGVHLNVSSRLRGTGPHIQRPGVLRPTSGRNRQRRQSRPA
jgi:CHAT domain